MSRYRGSGWTWDDKKQAYYFHQYSKYTPDLNHTNFEVRKQMLVGIMASKKFKSFKIYSVKITTLGLSSSFAKAFMTLNLALQF